MTDDRGQRTEDRGPTTGDGKKKRQTGDEREESLKAAEHTVLLEMARGFHTGQTNAIGMGELYQKVFGEGWEHRINDTRELRQVITRLRNKGIPICSVSDSTHPGYYMAAVGSELDNYLGRLRSKALKILKQEAQLRRLALPELLGQLAVEVGNG